MSWMPAAPGYFPPGSLSRTLQSLELDEMTSSFWGWGLHAYRRTCSSLLVGMAWSGQRGQGQGGWTAEGKGWLECQREGRLECRCNRTGQGLTRGGARMSNLRVGMAWSGQSSKCAPGLARVSNQGGALVSNQGGAGGAFGEGPG